MAAVIIMVPKLLEVEAISGFMKGEQLGVVHAKYISTADIGIGITWVWVWVWVGR